MSAAKLWKRCSDCKQPIELGATYWVCSVSTCNRNRMALQFCSVSCWDAHLSIVRHREAWAEERRAPTTLASEPVGAGTAAAKPAGKRRIVPSSQARSAPPAAAGSGVSKAPSEGEVLIVASRLKEFVRAESGFNTSDRVLEPLSAIVRTVIRRAIRNAERDGRKTVLDRDIPKD